MSNTILFLAVLITSHWILVISKPTLLATCVNRCFSKISNHKICDTTCEKLFLNEENTTRPWYVPSVPDPPRLLSNTFRAITVAWSAVSRDINNSVVYIAEVKRKTNVTDLLVILPELQRYHVVSTTEITIQQLQGKTSYSVRVAAVTIYGTLGFSKFSSFYQTNKTCKVYLQNNNNPFPCPVTNLRLRVTAHLTANRLHQNITATLYWDPPDDIEKLAGDVFSVRVVPFTSNPEKCGSFGRSSSYSKYVNKTSNSVVLEKRFVSTKISIRAGISIYLGCRYEIQVAEGNINRNLYFTSSANFKIPDCIQKLCACKALIYTPPYDDFETAQIENFQASGNNVANGTMIFERSFWGQRKTISFFVISFKQSLRSIDKHCPLPKRTVIFNNDTASTSRRFVTFTNVQMECYFIAMIKAFDSNACQLQTQQDLFLIVTTPTSPPTLTTIVTTPTTSANSSVILFGQLITSQGPSPAVGKQTQRRRNGALIAVAIVVPLILVILVIFLIILFVYKKRLGKPITFHRAPTGLQRTAIDNPNIESHIYHRNLDQSSALLGTSESSRLIVNLPPKCADSGLELNPAYVEQRIHEAIGSGETDEYEFGFHRLEIGRKLGKGAFGHVYIANAFGISGNPDKTVVAVKILRENASEDEKEDFKAEINFMKMIGKHDNIVTILGCCTLYEPLCLLVEYAPHGDLLHYLRDLRKKFEQEKRKCHNNNVDFPEALKGSRYSHRPLVLPLDETKKQNRRSLNDKDDMITFGEERRTMSFTSLSVGVGSNLTNGRSGSTSEFSTKDCGLLYVGRGEEGQEGCSASSQTVVTTASFGGSGSFRRKSGESSGSAMISLDGALDSSELQSFAYQISCGMEYLSKKGVLHRDLAARNILVGEDKILKISDFGLSREGVYVKRSTGKIPLRWLSIEAMRERIYSTASDVWAFGIVLWEICTLGGFPYPTINDRDLLKYLQDGKRMEKPSNCTDEIYQLMEACWSCDLEDRPSFTLVRELLWEMQKSEHPYVNVDPSQEIILPPVDQGHVGNLMHFSDTSISSSTQDDSQEERNGVEADNVPEQSLLLQEYNDRKFEEGEQNSKSNEELPNHNHGYENKNTTASENQHFLLKDLSDCALKGDEMLERLSTEMVDELDESTV